MDPTTLVDMLLLIIGFCWIVILIMHDEIDNRNKEIKELKNQIDVYEDFINYHYRY